MSLTPKEANEKLDQIEKLLELFEQSKNSKDDNIAGVKKRVYQKELLTRIDEKLKAFSKLMGPVELSPLEEEVTRAIFLIDKFAVMEWDWKELN